MSGKDKAGHRHFNKGNLFAEIHRLQSDRAYRDYQRCFYVEGVRNFVEAVKNQYEISRIIYSEKLLIVPLARKLVRQLRRSGIPTLRLTPEEFRSISQTRRASGVGAILRQRWQNLENVSPVQGLCWTVLDQVRFGGNLGTLIRTSEAIGGAGFVFLGDRIDLYSSSITRAAMGAVFRQSFVRTTAAQLQRWRSRHGAVIIGASPEGPIDFHTFRFPEGSLLVLGDERRGLTAQQNDMCDYIVRIPMEGKADSLNLGVAGSLLMYEVYRSRMYGYSVND
jgi:TrmH family RNA methyltransferase